MCGIQLRGLLQKNWPLCCAAKSVLRRWQSLTLSRMRPSIRPPTIFLSNCFPPGLITNTLYVFLISLIHATYPGVSIQSDKNFSSQTFLHKRNCAYPWHCKCSAPVHLFLFIYSLFNEALSSSDGIVSYGRISEYWIEKNTERTGVEVLFWNLPECAEKTIKYLSEDSVCQTGLLTNTSQNYCLSQFAQ